MSEVSRYTRAREMAGLSIAQASKQLGWSRTSLVDIEAGLGSTEAHDRRLAKLYGVWPAWLRGADPVIPAVARQFLADAVLSENERADLEELFGAIYTPERR